MEKQIFMPKLAPQMQEGILVGWCKRSGDKVSAGEALFEVETDKVVSEVESPLTGTLTQLLCAEGEAVAVGAPVAAVRMES